MKVELLSITPNAEHLIAKAYGICTGGRGTKEIPLENITLWIRQGHESPIEHASATFLITGISRSCLAQLTRHRHTSFSVESMRYVEQGVSFVEPLSIENAAVNENGIVAKLDEWYMATLRLYTLLLEAGVPKEDARFVLPLATETCLMMTANFSSWLHIFRVRALNPHAQWEIRKLCLKMLEILRAEAPHVFCVLDGEDA